MRKRILLTGITGFIGRNVAIALQQKGYDITALVRPGTKSRRLQPFTDAVKIISIDLCDSAGLEKYLATAQFDCIMHIGALRGGRKFSNEAYYLANVVATQILADYAYRNNCRLVFCSSVGVFGAIPLELPANNQTERQEDNYYHKTKIHAEKSIEKLVLTGLDAIIIRPAITYGIGDNGFPLTLIKLVDKNWMFLPDKLVWVHLTHIDLLVEAFTKVVELDIPTGSAFNVADLEAVKLIDLVNYISQELHGRPLPHYHIINKKYFEWGEKVARNVLKNELWVSRFELISKSWMYDVRASYAILQLTTRSTIPDISFVIDWYKKQK